MRNLKRALSLAVASVMLLGMMVVGTGAYDDVTASHNEEAIAVMEAAGIMIGDDQGNFNPDQKVTRNQMAVVMCNILGYDAPDYAGVAPFVDVPAWAETFVSACYANGIVAGADATHYNGEATVTAAEAGLMVMKALGYFQFASDFGTDWKLAVITKGSEIDLYDGISAGANTALTRNDVAQLVLNTLESVMVKGEQTGTTGSVTAGDVKVELNGVVNYYDKKNDADYDKSDDKNDGKMYLIEELYEDLSKDDGSDKFGRPGYGWYEKKDEVIFVADEALATYAGADFDKDTLKDDFEDWTVVDNVVYNGGDDAKVNLAYLQKSIENMFIEVYGDDDDEKIEKIVAYQYYIAEVDDVNTDDDDEVTDINVTIYEYNATATINIDVEKDEDEYALFADYEEDDLVMVVAKPGFDTNKKASDILAVADVETVEGKATAISVDKGFNGWVKIDGVKYTFANEYVYLGKDQVAKGAEGAFYLFNDYVVAFDGEATDADDEYLYLVRANVETGKWDDSYYAEVVFADGKCEEIYFELGEKETLKDYAAGVYTYEYDEDDEVYTLVNTGVKAEKVDIEKGKTAVATGIKANGKTVYVAIELDKGAFDDATVATGYRNVSSIAGDAYIISDKGTAEYVFVIDGKTSTSSTDLIFVAGASVSNKIEDDDLGDYYEYNAIIDGEIVKIMAVAGDYNELYDGSDVDKNDVYTLTASKEIDAKTATGKFEKAADEVIGMGTAGDLAYAEDVVMFVIDTDGKITKGDITKNYSEDTDYSIKLIYTENDDDEVDAIYLVKVAK